MIFGFSTFTWVHIALSLVGLASGFVVLIGLLASKRLEGWTALFLASTVATSATGFGFAFERFGASQWFGVISLAVLLLAILARYVFHLAGAWHWIYAVGAVFGFYTNVFVAITEAFVRAPALHAMAPTLAEPPFAIAQAGTLALFVVLAIAAAIKFRPSAAN
jgi:hypothetical protein